jgi:hypothetical protein
MDAYLNCQKQTVDTTSWELENENKKLVFPNLRLRPSNHSFKFIFQKQNPVPISAIKDLKNAQCCMQLTEWDEFINSNQTTSQKPEAIVLTAERRI